MGREHAAGIAVAGEAAPSVPAGAAEAAEEARLVAAARADPEAFVALYRRYVGPVHRYLLGQVSQRADAEDLTADLDALALPLPDGDPSPEDGALAREQAATLHRLLGELPPEQREAVALHYFAGLPTAEIAAIQGRSGGAIRMRLHRALAALRARYPQEELP